VRWLSAPLFLHQKLLDGRNFVMHIRVDLYVCAKTKVLASEDLIKIIASSYDFFSPAYGKRM
jgi:hypothetical protein